MEDQNIQTRKEEHSRIHNRIWSFSYESRHRWPTCIFLLKKNAWVDIIKTILEYPPIAALEILKEWKMAITLVGQEYKSTEGWHDYQTETGIIYGGWGLPIEIRKSNENFKNRKSKCFNCKIYGHMAKDCWRPKKEKDT